MNFHFYRYIAVVAFLVSVSCSHGNIQTGDKDNIKLPKIIPSIIVDKKISATDEVSVTEAEETGIAACPGSSGCPDMETADIAEGNENDDRGSQVADDSEPATADAEVTEENSENEADAQEILDTALDFVNASQEFWADGNSEKAIETLDRAYELVLKVDTESRPDLIQQQEDLRFMTAKRILEIYASRFKAVNGDHGEIPLIMNEHVEKEIKSFQGPEREYFMESYKRSGLYIDKIKEALRDAGLPEELAWLPHIESWFKVRALSSARALGIWQFIPSTGYKFGLKRDAWIDERMDPEKATAAAIAYLKELHQMFGDWTTVLAAYNCGEGAVLRKIRNQKINYLDNFWDLYNQLPLETARYVPRFLATLHILKDPAKYGFTLDETAKPVSYETVNIQKQTRLKSVSEAMGITLDELAALNPELRLQVTPPTSYSLKIPSGSSEKFLACVESIPELAVSKDDIMLASGAYVYHRVRSGETLASIARKYHSSTRSIARANNLNRKYFIRAGQKLKIPLRGSSLISAAASGEDHSPDGKYRVKKGDTLWLIARKFNTDAKTLQQINKLRSTTLKAGQILIVRE